MGHNSSLKMRQEVQLTAAVLPFHLITQSYNELLVITWRTKVERVMI